MPFCSDKSCAYPDGTKVFCSAMADHRGGKSHGKLWCRPGMAEPAAAAPRGIKVVGPCSDARSPLSCVDHLPVAGLARLCQAMARPIVAAGLGQRAQIFPFPGVGNLDFDTRSSRTPTQNSSGAISVADDHGWIANASWCEL